MEILLTGIGILSGIIILYLGTVIFLPIFNVPGQPLSIEGHPLSKHMSQPTSRQDVTFKIKRTELNAWLYLPLKISTPVHCIVMSHGFGGTKDMILESYALRFVEEGMASLSEPEEEEDDRVEEAPGLQRNSRLSCQCEITGTGPIVVRVPAWNRNAVKETPH